MAMFRALSGSGGGGSASIKTVTIDKTIKNGTVDVTGLSKILAVFASMTTNMNEVYGGGIDNNGTWQKISYAGGTNGVTAVASDGSSFTWTDTDNRSLRYMVLGIE